jgi:hypothetical protein
VEEFWPGELQVLRSSARNSATASQFFRERLKGDERGLPRLFISGGFLAEGARVARNR